MARSLQTVPERHLLRLQEYCNRGGFHVLETYVTENNRTGIYGSGYGPVFYSRAHLIHTATGKKRRVWFDEGSYRWRWEGNRKKKES